MHWLSYTSRPVPIFRRFSSVTYRFPAKHGGNVPQKTISCKKRWKRPAETDFPQKTHPDIKLKTLNFFAESAWFQVIQIFRRALIVIYATVCDRNGGVLNYNGHDTLFTVYSQRSASFDAHDILFLFWMFCFYNFMLPFTLLYHQMFVSFISFYDFYFFISIFKIPWYGVCDGGC